MELEISLKEAQNFENIDDYLKRKKSKESLIKKLQAQGVHIKLCKKFKEYKLLKHVL